MGDSDATFAGGLLREFQRGDLDDLDPEYLSEVAGKLSLEEVDRYHSLMRAFEEVEGYAFEDTAFHDDLVTRAADKSGTRALWEENPTVIQNQVGLRDHGKSNAEGWDVIEAELRQEGVTLLVNGGSNDGKTNFCMRCAEKWCTENARPRSAVVTNVPVKDDRIRFAETETTVKEECADVDGRALIIGDELGREGAGDKGGSEASKFIDFCKEIRKDPWNAGLVATMHNDTDLDKDLRELADVGIHKPNKKSAHVYRVEGAGKGIFDGDHFMLRSIRRSTIPYKDHKSPSFTFDEEKEEEKEPEEIQKERDKEIAQKMRDNGAPAQEIAEAVGWSEDWVYKHTTNPEEN